MNDNNEAIDWEQIQELYYRDEIVELHVHTYNRGGLLIHGEGIHGFVPVSHLINIPGKKNEKDRRRRLVGYIGCSLKLKVIECEPTLERIVFSERAAIAGGGKRKCLFQPIRTGDVVMGVVTNVTDFGDFVDLGGVEGLIHVSELSWGRVRHPSNILDVGQNVDALMLQVSEESVRVALSLKRLLLNPWKNLVKQYRPGDMVPATITAIMSKIGAFGRLKEVIEGLIHVSSIDLLNNQKDLEMVLSPGQVV